LRREQPMHAKLAASSTTWTTGLAPLGHISWPKFHRFRWIPARFRSLAAFVMSRPWGLMGRYTGVGVRGTVEKKREAGRVGGAVRKKGCNTRTSQGVTHPSTTLAQARLTSDGATGGTSNLPGGVTLRTGGATPRAAYAREARRELHDVDNWACPVGPHFVAQISPFSVDSGAFSIVGRIRDESAVGSHGEIYRGWGARNGREKAGSWTGGRSSSQKGVQHEDFPGGHPSYGATGGTSNLPGGVTLRTGGATPRAAYAREARRELHDVDNWACPVGPHFVAQISPFSVDSGAFSIVGRIRDESAVGSHGEIYRGWGARNGREKAGSWTGGRSSSQKGVQHEDFPGGHPSYGATGGTSNLPGGVTLRTGGATPRAAYAREARRELHDVDNWACPVGPHFVAQISPFSVDSGAFSIVGRIRDESAVGSHGEIYRGWGARNGREKAGSWTGGRSSSQKGVQHEDFPGGHPSYGATGGTSNLPGGVTLRTGGATPRAAYAREARRELHDVDNWACPVGPHFVAQISPFSVDSGAFSIVGRIRDESAVGSHGEIYRGWGARNGREKAGSWTGGRSSSQKGVQHEDFPGGHPSYGATGGTSNLPGGVTLRTGGATPRAAYAREARRELHDVDNWACPVGPHFVAQISPFSVDSGAFSIVGRIRDESAVGSHGEIYRGWGARNGREKAGSWTGGRSSSQKGVQHEDFPGGHPSYGATGGTSNLPGGVTLRTGGATPRAAYAREARRELHDVDNWACPVGPHFVAQISPFSVDSGAFSIVGRIRDESAVGSHGEIYRGWGARNGREKAGSWTGGRSSSQKGVQHEDFPGGHPSYGATGGTSNLPGGVTLRTGGATPRAAYAREARRELHDVDNWACPVGPHFVAQISPFSVDSGAFSIVGRIRDESAVGSHGEIYRGWGARNGREKAGSWTGGRSSSQKGVQHEDFPGGHPSYGATGGTSNLPGGVTLRTGGATPRAAYAREARRELHDVDNWACPVGPHFVAQISPFSVDSGAFSIVGRIRDESAVWSHGEIYRGWGARNGREKAGSWTGGRSSSQKGVQHEDFPGGHPSYGATGGTSNLPGGVTLRTGGATPRAAYAREARRELHDVDNWACPVGPHFVAQISPFSVDSGAFSIVGRIRDESAVGSHGEIYRGWGARNGREKAGSWTGGRSSSQKGVQHEDFPGGHPSYGATGGTSNLPGGVTLRTGGATPRAAYAREARRELHDVDNWACPVGPHFVAQISPFSVDSGAFSIVGRIRDESAVGSHGEIYRGWGARNGREKAGSWTGGRSSSQKGVQHEDFPGGHPSYGATGGTSNLPGGVTLRTGGATPRAAYAREARRELHDVDNWACPVGPHFVAQISPFSVDSGAFSIVGRIRDESAVGSHGEIYRGWGARNGREKAGSWTGGRSSSQKGVQHEDFPGGHPSYGATGGTSNLPGGVTLRTGGATPRAAYAREARRELHDVDNWACPVGPHFVAQISPFSVDSGAFSIVGRIRDESAVGSHGEIYRGWGARNGREKAGSWTGGRSSSQKGVQHEDFPGGHPSYGATGGTSNLPGGVTLRTGGATPRAAYAREARRELHDVDNWACPVGPHFVAQISPFSVDSGAFSIVGRIRDESAVGSHGEIYRGWGARNGREKAGSWTGGRSSSQKGVQHEDFPGGHPSYGATGGTSNLPGGVTLRTGGATPRAAYAREARRELHDVDNWACPVGPHFVAQISPFSVDSGAFSIVGRIRDESAVGSHGEIYRGWGARNGREKAGSWTGGRSSSQKGVQHEDFPGGHPSYGATGGTSNLPGGVTLRTGGATPRAAYAREARRELHDVDNWACPVGPHFVAQISPFSVDSGAFSIVGRIRDESAVGSHGEIYRGWGARNGREKAGSWTGGRSSSQKGVQHEDFPGGHPSYGATGGTSNLPGGVTLRTGGATPRAAYAREARRELHDVDNWACPVGPHFVAQISPFSVDSGAFSIVGRIRDESAVGSHGEIYRGWGARNGREKAGSWTGGRSSSQKGVQHEDFPGGHPSYGATGGTSNLPGGVTLRTGGATPRAAYAREARRELHDVDNWACPVGPHFVAQISPFSVDSGAFSIVGRIRDESAVGSHGEIYRGWGARNGREKAGSWTGGRSSSQKGVQHEDFPGGHPSYGATGGTSNLPGGVTLRTGGATPRAAYAREARRELHDVDNWACPVGPHFVAQISPFSVDSGAFSIVGRIRDESAVGSHGEIYRGWGARNGREKAGSWTGGRSSSQKGVQHEDFPGGHPSYGATGGTSNLPGGVTLRTGGATPRAAYAREARRELHDVDNWACPVGPHFVAQISPFSVDSGAFSIVGRIRDESAVGSHGEIYRGWGARNGREKAGSWTGGRSSSQKGVQHEDFPGGHPSYGATGGTSNLPGGVTLRTGGATPRAAYAREARRELHDVDNWACPVGPHFVAQISPFSVDSGAFSIVGRIRDESAVGSHGEIYRGWGARNGREKAGSWTGGRSSSQKGVQHEDFPGGHPSYGATGGTSNLPGGVTLRTGGATPRAAYAREARRELHDVDNWACPVGPHFVAQISPFSVDSGAFSIVGRIRDESAVGSHGEIYRGWGARNGREKAGSWTGGRSSSQKGVQHEDFPGGHPS
ncbi:UNVERIFIED_CONTAM: hypothetical protein Sindi_2921000, partial [Sesamum indicum]